MSSLTSGFFFSSEYHGTKRSTVGWTADRAEPCNKGQTINYTRFLPAWRAGSPNSQAVEGSPVTLHRVNPGGCPNIH